MANDSDSDDYLSEKFLVDAAAPSKPQTYVERRRAAQRESAIKQERNRKRSRRELEEESRKEGLSTSLFTRASEDGGNKAMAMMLKMGFKPGQSLGAGTGEDDSTSKDDVAETSSMSHTKHRVEPLPVNMWQGRKGVGLGKRPALPGETERAAKVARVADDENRTDFRGRAREDWEDRRAEGRMAAARRTCKSLDEKAGREFNVFWLDPHDPASFPPELLDALTMEGAPGADGPLEDEDDDIGIPTAALAMRLRREMRQYQLRDITPEAGGGDGEGDEQPSKKEATSRLTVTPEMIQQAKDFLASPTRDRLKTLLGYLREQYSYCFWCGAEYEDLDDLQRHCPGTDEEDHD